MPRTPALTFLALAAAVTTAGCGAGSKSTDAAAGAGMRGDSGAAGDRAAQVVRTAADPDGGLYFSRRELGARAGKLTLAMRNPSTSGMVHGIAVAGLGVVRVGPVVGPGATARLTLTLAPGRYRFYCPVPGHRAAGMRGTLVVR
jgi:plastocyanin